MTQTLRLKGNIIEFKETLFSDVNPWEWDIFAIPQYQYQAISPSEGVEKGALVQAGTGCNA